jgi:DNA-binding transcriptional regulator YdaS (Cro superfamily)
MKFIHTHLEMKAAGSVSALARALGITHSAVSQWRKVPAERVIDVERATGIPREKLRPDLYPLERAA